MAMRPRAPTSRPKKPGSPAFSGSVLDDETRGEPPVLTEAVEREEAQDDEQSSFERGPVAKITEATLEQREIPTYGMSREERIAVAAYWRAERRGFTPGHELDDWLDAEKEVDAQQTQGVPKTG